MRPAHVKTCKPRVKICARFFGEIQDTCAGHGLLLLVTPLPPAPSICTPIRAKCTVRRMQLPYVVTLRITCMGPARPNPAQATFDYEFGPVSAVRRPITGY